MAVVLFKSYQTPGILYTAELEIFYYFIEPALEDVIKKVRAKMLRNLDEAYEELRDKYNV
ncbi:hypothetical protein J1781_02800 [Rahnella sp. C60]|jgi:hypothetical protein|uniref:Uncharacterized protein n=2 Tax=Rahnella TaxID=34037 RepID=H2IWU6_RAHAC|nr:MULTISPECIES: hypothetical protein [Rahnella]UJD88046.1 hypothetical protein FS594_04205 [Rahnella aquatilis]AEX50758.1 hypothetical protein Rahaq2_0850 [Rahnella aquatilis CIP 78.65 = ATCC 33071]MBU9813785.1 hypothetical protein [Rahnella perminowiae]MBU9834247.1 hypothetical protein [Rahnella perminowiae]MCR9002905.1 hypothetical protein [Rahnella perminowiae]